MPVSGFYSFSDRAARARSKYLNWLTLIVWHASGFVQARFRIPLEKRNLRGSRSCMNGGFMHIEKLIVGLTLLGLPTLSLAAVRVLPEPETLGLVAGAAIAWAIVRWKKRK